jgi:hypothetical protein
MPEQAVLKMADSWKTEISTSLFKNAFYTYPDGLGQCLDLDFAFGT